MKTRNLGNSSLVKEGQIFTNPFLRLIEAFFVLL
jgi:hypothetical protein